MSAFRQHYEGGHGSGRVTPIMAFGLMKEGWAKSALIGAISVFCRQDCIKAQERMPKGYRWALRSQPPAKPDWDDHSLRSKRI